MTAIAHLGDGKVLDGRPRLRDGPYAGAATASAPLDGVGFIGVVSPMTSLGFAPFSYLGLVHPEGLVLSSAAYYQVTFTRQQERIVEELLATPYDQLSRRRNVLLYPRHRIEGAELTRQFLVGYRLDLRMRGGRTTRLVLQQRRIDEVRHHLPTLVGDTWTDLSLEAA